MRRHANPNQTTPTETTHQTTTTAPPRRGEAWWQTALFTASLVAVGGLLAGFEWQAGRNAGFSPWVAVGVPLAFDAYALWTWLDPDRSRWDELAAVGILAASVALSAVPARNWLALGIGMLAILVQWRNASRRRAARGRGYALAAAVAEVERVRGEGEASAAEWRRQLAALEAGGVAARAAAPPPPSGGRGGGPVIENPPWGRTKKSQIEWLRRELAAGRDRTGQEVSDLMGLGSRRTGGDRLAAARQLHLVERGA